MHGTISYCVCTSVWIQVLSCALISIEHRVWEMLPPMYDATSDITLNLLMKLMNVDPQCFLTCVYQVFENKDWEVR